MNPNNLEETHMEDVIEAIRPHHPEGVSASQAPSVDSKAPDSVHIDIWMRDKEVVGALTVFDEGRMRDDYTRTAIRIGVAALQHAQGQIDADAVRNEGERLISLMEARLSLHQSQFSAQLTGTMQEYFAPESGRLTERIERFIKKDGEFENVMRAQIATSADTLKTTLAAQVGADSPLVQLLTPNDSNVLVATIRSTVDDLVNAQRDVVLKEFSMNNKEGALHRLLAELSLSNGALTGDLKTTIEQVVSEFSLDREDSALSRLVRRVEQAQQQISAEFTLDADGSALSRMKRELVSLIDTLRKDSQDFQQNVVAALEAMKARKQESLASTRHGKEFEIAAYDVITVECQKAGDIPEQTGDRPGMIKHCKVGDCVITLGPDCEASGARIVCEMKQDASYDLRRALDDLGIALTNRGSDIGLFVFSKRTAPAGLRPLARYGSNFVVVWDAEDESTDIFLSASLMVCKAIALQGRGSKQDVLADFEAIEKAIREIERQAGFLDEIKTTSTTIKSGAEKILNRVESMRTALTKQIEALDAQIGLLRSSDAVVSHTD